MIPTKLQSWFWHLFWQVVAPPLHALHARGSSAGWLQCLSSEHRLEWFIWLVAFSSALTSIRDSGLACKDNPVDQLKLYLR